MLQVALVGGAHCHTPNFVRKLADAEDVETRYVWDPDRDYAERRQEVTGGEIVDNVDAIFNDANVQAVVICSQTDRHEHLVTRAAEAGKHMFVEKPLGFGPDDANRMADAIERAGVHFQTGYFQRGRPEVQYVRHLIESDEVGKVTRLRLSLCHTGALRGIFDTEWRWMADLDQAGCGGYGDLGTHVLDLLLYLMHADKVVDCTGCVASATGRYGDIDEYGEGMIRFASGAIGTVAAGWVDHANPNYLELSGIEGHVRITDGEVYHTRAGDKQATHVTDLPEAWPHAFDLFLDAVRGKDVPLVAPREAAWRNVVMDAIYTGARERRWVSV